MLYFHGLVWARPAAFRPQVHLPSLPRLNVSKWTMASARNAITFCVEDTARRSAGRIQQVGSEKEGTGQGSPSIQSPREGNIIMDQIPWKQNSDLHLTNTE